MSLSFFNFCRIAAELEKETKVRILRHANIVAVVAKIFETGHYGIVMEHVLHRSLEDFVFNYDVCRSVSTWSVLTHIAKLWLLCNVCDNSIC